MSYATGTITSANPSADLYTQLATLLTAAGYTLVDTVVISTRTHKIWKCAAANNTAGVDWYVDITYSTTSTGDLFIIPMEFFDPATDLAYRTSFGGLSNNTIDATTSSRWGATGQTLESASLSPTAASATSPIRVACTTASFGYWLSVTGNRILAMSSNEQTGILFAGLYEPTAIYAAAAGAALFPLVVAKFFYTGVAQSATTMNVAGSGATVFLTRVPPMTVMPISGWGAMGYARPEWVGNGGTSPILAPVPSGATTFQNGNRYASRIVLLATESYQPTGAVGGVLGYFPDILEVPTAGSVARGDTVTIGGAQWIFASNGGSGATASSVLMKAA